MDPGDSPARSAPGESPEQTARTARSDPRASRACPGPWAFPETRGLGETQDRRATPEPPETQDPGETLARTAWTDPPAHQDPLDPLETGDRRDLLDPGASRACLELPARLGSQARMERLAFLGSLA